MQQNSYKYTIKPLDLCTSWVLGLGYWVLGVLLLGLLLGSWVLWYFTSCRSSRTAYWQPRFKNVQKSRK